MNPSAVLDRVPTSMLLGARVATERLKQRRAWVGATLGLLASAVIAAVERKAASHGAADRALIGMTFAIALPLVAYATAQAALGGARLDQSVQVLARHGANRRSAALGVMAISILVIAFEGALLGGVSAAVAHGFRASGLSDVGASVWIGALAGAAYASYLGVASCFGRKGGWRFGFLALDFLLGASSGAFAVAFPRGHVRNLLGGEPVLHWPQFAAAGALIGASCLALLVLLHRTKE